MTWYRAKDADIIQDVQIGKDSSIFYHAVLRGDDAPIRIGNCVNVQDGCILHAAKEHPLTIMDGTSIGHGAILHGCTIGKNCLIGMGSIIMDGAVIEDNSIVAAGALIPSGKRFEKNALLMGSPARFIRPVQPEELQKNKDNAKHYVLLAREQLIAIEENKNVDC